MRSPRPRRWGRRGGRSRIERGMGGYTGWLSGQAGRYGGEGVEWWEQAPGWAGLGRHEGHGHGLWLWLSQLLAFGTRTGTGTGKGTVNKLAWRFFFTCAFPGQGEGQRMEGGAFAHFPRRGLDSRRMDVSLYRYYDIWLVGRLEGWRVGGLGLVRITHLHHVDLHTYAVARLLA